MQTPTERIASIIQSIAEQHHTNIAVIRGRAKDKFTVAVRRAVCEALHAEGLSSTQIGEKINRNRTSVLNLLGLLRRNEVRRQRHAANQQEK